MKITFWGGVGEVTGSNYLLEDQEVKIIIDCGLFQGTKEALEKNFSDFVYKPEEIEAVLITHAHVDHIGRLPKLLHDGFQGNIFSTGPTKDMAHELLIDSYKVLRNNLGSKKLIPYRESDIERVISQWKTVPYHQRFKIKNFEIEYIDAGHILGSASLKISSGGKTIIFSSDLGNVPTPIVKDTEYFKDAADYVLLESTYGARAHEALMNRKEVLRETIIETVNRKSVLLIPAFAMERTQELLYELNDLVENKQIPSVPIFIDSSLAIRLTAIYQQYANNHHFFDQESIALIKKGDNIFDFAGLKFTLSVEESKNINDVPPPKVIIASSGMGEGGRVIHHEIRYLPDSNNTILFVGFQAPGTKGRQILEREKKINILDQEVEINAKIKFIDGYSAHADQVQLLKWVDKLDKSKLNNIFVVHGDPEQSEILAKRINNQFNIKVVVPKLGQTVEL